MLGIEAQLTEEIRVKSLQDHAYDLDLYGRRAAVDAAAVAPVPAEVSA